MKQKKLVNFIKKNKEKFSRNNVVIFNDKIKNPTVTYNQFSSQWRNGIFKRALGHEKNYVIHVSQIEAYLNGKFDSKFDGHHLAKDHVREDKANFIFLNIESKGLLNFDFSIEKILIN